MYVILLIFFNCTSLTGMTWEDGTMTETITCEYWLRYKIILICHHTCTFYSFNFCCWKAILLSSNGHNLISSAFPSDIYLLLHAYHLFIFMLNNWQFFNRNVHFIITGTVLSIMLQHVFPNLSFSLLLLGAHTFCKLFFVYID